MNNLISNSKASCRSCFSANVLLRWLNLDHCSEFIGVYGDCFHMKLLVCTAIVSISNEPVVDSYFQNI